MDYVSIAVKNKLFNLKKLRRFADERKKMAFSFAIPLICSTFALAKENSVRDLAQLVAYYVRDVGVVRSSRIIPTEAWESDRFPGLRLCCGLRLFDESAEEADYYFPGVHVFVVPRVFASFHFIQHDIFARLAPAISGDID